MPEIQMPKLSDTMTEGTLVAWKKKKGDQVSAGDVLAEIETDKATMEWESPEDGTLTEIYVQEGGKVNVGDKIAFIGGEGEEAPKEEAPEQKEEEQPKPAEQKKEKSQVSRHHGGQVCCPRGPGVPASRPPGGKPKAPKQPKTQGNARQAAGRP